MILVRDEAAKMTLPKGESLIFPLIVIVSCMVAL